MLEKSLEIDPKFITALFLVGIVCGILGDHNKASQSFKQIIKDYKQFQPFQIFKDQKGPNLFFEMTLFGLAVSISRLNEYIEIFNLYTSLLTAKETRQRIHEALINGLKRLAKKNPAILLLLIETGYLYYISEDKDILENVTKLPPPQLDNEISFTDYGFVNLLIGDFTKAKNVLKDAIGKKDLKDPILPLYLLGIAYGCLNRHEKAMQSFRKVLEISDQYYLTWFDQYDIAWFGLGLSHTRSDEYIKLIKLLTSERFLFDSMHLNAEFFDIRILKKDKDLHKMWYEKTINALESFVQSNPDNALASRDLDAIKDSYKAKIRPGYFGSSSKPREKVKASVDAETRGIVKAFLDWVKDPEGLAGYISYYLAQNDPHVISELSKIFKEFKQICGV